MQIYATPRCGCASPAPSPSACPHPRPWLHPRLRTHHRHLGFGPFVLDAIKHARHYGGVERLGLRGCRAAFAGWNSLLGDAYYGVVSSGGVDYLYITTRVHASYKGDNHDAAIWIGPDGFARSRCGCLDKEIVCHHAMAILVALEHALVRVSSQLSADIIVTDAYTANINDTDLFMWSKTAKKAAADASRSGKDVPPVVWVTDRGFRLIGYVMKHGQRHRTPTFKVGDRAFTPLEATNTTLVARERAENERAVVSG